MVSEAWIPARVGETTRPLDSTPRSFLMEVIRLLARPGLPQFQYIRARDPSEVCQILEEGGARLLMGGTDLFPQMREGRIRPRVVVDVKRLPGMAELREDESGLVCGAAVTMNELARHAAVVTRYSALSDAAGSVGSYQLRNRATVGGNICNASPCADTAPVIGLFDATLELVGLDGRRSVTASDFFVGPGHTSLATDEYLQSIRLPIPARGTKSCYLKLGRNRLGDLSLVGVAAMGFPDTSSPSGFRFRLALGSVAPVPLRARAAEELLATRPPGERAFAAAAEAAMEASMPISDVRAGDQYQREMVRVLTLRALRHLWAELTNGRGD
jgi:CO/xanthine dehydrogenase FAD-binding subunit